ncbi:NUDIX hydrolase [Thiolapillus sp.]|uniref:NUDIX hydrolase n=1 Tax=Thiolapillus sp. TaxID=2017437 RepID=UPI0025F5E9F3|nr:NUDIX hydrolase [Thiolapillus sp.]
MIWKPHVTVAAVIEQDARFLLVEEHIDGRAVFNQPAGHLEQGESLPDAAVREVLEETARDFAPQALLGTYLYRLKEKQRSYLRFCFTGEVGAADPARSLDREIIATHWLTLDQIRARENQLRSPMVLQCIHDYLRGVRLPLNSLHHLEA